jgi:hypothetical protein
LFRIENLVEAGGVSWNHLLGVAGIAPYRHVLHLAQNGKLMAKLLLRGQRLTKIKKFLI